MNDLKNMMESYKNLSLEINSCSDVVEKSEKKREQERKRKEIVPFFPTSVTDAKKIAGFSCKEFLDFINEHQELLQRAKFLSFVHDIVNQKDPEFELTEEAVKIWIGFAFNPE